MSRLSASRLAAHVPTLGTAIVIAATSSILLAGPASAGNSAISVKVTPDRGLVNGQEVTVSGHGLSRSPAGSGLTWFITECNAAVHGRVNPATDTSHCDVTDAKAIRISRDGTFSTKFRVRAGIIGDGYCGAAGRISCVLGVSTAKGQGTVVKVTFAPPTPPTTSTTTTPTKSSTRPGASPS